MPNSKFKISLSRHQGISLNVKKAYHRWSGSRQWIYQGIHNGIAALHILPKANPPKLSPENNTCYMSAGTHRA